jgi:CheY-like chemotaxis protein/HPt (histidine-containing phosphotransfer) domain-containing protein
MNQKNARDDYFSKGTILVADDNEMSLNVTCDYITRAGMTPCAARNGQEAVSAVKQRISSKSTPFDLILLDIHMPEMNGKDAASIITDLNTGTPIIAMTADIITTAEEKLYKSVGISGYLKKPFASGELRECLHKYMRSEGEASRSEFSFPGSAEILEDEKLQTELKILFMQTNENTIDNMLKYEQENDIKNAHIIVHTIKNSAKLIGETRLSKISEEAELSLANSPGAFNHELITRFADELRKVLDKLSIYY